MVVMGTCDWKKLFRRAGLKWVEVGSTFGLSVGFGYKATRFVLGITLCSCVWEMKTTIMLLHEVPKSCIKRFIVYVSKNVFHLVLDSIPCA